MDDNEEAARDSDPRVAESDRPEDPGSHDEKVIDQVESAVVECEEAGHQHLERAGIPFPDLLRTVGQGGCPGNPVSHGRSIGEQDRKKCEDPDDDALGPVDEDNGGEIPVPGNCQHDGQEVAGDEGDKRRGKRDLPGQDAGRERRDRHGYVPVGAGLTRTFVFVFRYHLSRAGGEGVPPPLSFFPDGGEPPLPWCDVK